MRIPLVLVGALLFSGLPALSQTFTFQVTYGPNPYFSGYGDSANLIVQAVVDQPATPESPFTVWDITSMTGTWTSSYGSTAGQTFQVAPPFGNDIFGVIGPNNLLGSGFPDLCDVNFDAGPYEVSVWGAESIQPETEYVTTNNPQYSANYGLDGIGGTYYVQGKLIATAPFEPSDVVFILGGTGFIAMMWRKRRAQSVKHALN